eukprot:scaffold888_cov208-Alexandrium_tamarense.AAC.1
MASGRAKNGSKGREFLARRSSASDDVGWMGEGWARCCRRLTDWPIGSAIELCLGVVAQGVALTLYSTILVERSVVAVELAFAIQSSGCLPAKQGGSEGKILDFMDEN